MTDHDTIDLSDFLSECVNKATVREKADKEKIIEHLVNNNWYGENLSITDNKVILTSQQANLYREKLHTFLTVEANGNNALRLLGDKFPLTAENLKDYISTEKLKNKEVLYICDYLIYSLKTEAKDMTNEDADSIINNATNTLSKRQCEHLISFLNSLQKKKFSHIYTIQPQKTKNDAYPLETYIRLMYFLYNEKYIKEHDMLVKAANDKGTADTWLFLALHYICALRYTDLQRFPHPVLPYSPEDTLSRIRDQRFDYKDAIYVLQTIISNLSLLQLKPNKTKDRGARVGTIHFHVPTSCQQLIGTLFAIVEAHWQIATASDQEAGLDTKNKDYLLSHPLIRKITRYDTIRKNLGEDIGNLFLSRDFSSRAATKSYLQSIYSFAEEAIDGHGIGGIKGYMLAATARTHVGDYGQFARTTMEYIKDAQLTGLTPEFVQFELQERGVLSFTITKLLSSLNKEKGTKVLTKASMASQTLAIKDLGLTPLDVESVVLLLEQSDDIASKIINEAIRSNKSIISILHNIGNDSAFSKSPESLCFVSATQKMCPYPARQQCIGCKYEISTFSTIFQLAKEMKRTQNLYNISQGLEREKYKYLFQQILSPKLAELLGSLKTNYGNEIQAQYLSIIKELIS